MTDFEMAEAIIEKLKLKMPAEHQSSIVCPFPVPLTARYFLSPGPNGLPSEWLWREFWHRCLLLECPAGGGFKGVTRRGPGGHHSGITAISAMTRAVYAALEDKKC